MFHTESKMRNINGTTTKITIKKKCSQEFTYVVHADYGNRGCGVFKGGIQN